MEPRQRTAGSLTTFLPPQTPAALAEPTIVRQALPRPQDFLFLLISTEIGLRLYSKGPQP